MTNFLSVTHQTLYGKDLDDEFPAVKSEGISKLEIMHAPYGRILLKKQHMLASKTEDQVNPAFGKGLVVNISCHPLNDGSEDPFLISFGNTSEIADYARLEYDFTKDRISLSIQYRTPDGTHKTANLPYAEGTILVLPCNAY